MSTTSLDVGSLPPALLAAPSTAQEGKSPVATAPATPETTAPRKCVLDSLVGTILSQNTTDTNSHRAFGILKSRFPTWEQVRVAKPRLVEAGSCVHSPQLFF